MRAGLNFFHLAYNRKTHRLRLSRLRHGLRRRFVTNAYGRGFVPQQFRISALPLPLLYIKDMKTILHYRIYIQYLTARFTTCSHNIMMHVHK